MALYAAVTTGKGSAAIATIQISGEQGRSVVEKIFRTTSVNPHTLETGNVLLGSIMDGDRIIDQVTIGCEESNLFAIHCHGNPLIVEQIAQLLQKQGAELLTAEEFLSRIAFPQEDQGTIEIEAKLAQLEARTVAGTKLIANQIVAGLTDVANRWLNDLEKISLDDICKSAANILAQSKIAKLIIQGCKVVLIGPPNSGKSTLLNTLAGREKAIVSHIEGTTRDWVQAQCHIEPLEVTLIDTAGLIESLSDLGNDQIEHEAQQRTVEMLQEADLVLLVLDAARPVDQLSNVANKMLAGRLLLTVLNKSDLPEKLDIQQLPQYFGEPVRISAKQNVGIDELRRRILQITDTGDFDLSTAITFTPRQNDIISQLATTESEQQARSFISQLLNGPAAV